MVLAVSLHTDMSGDLPGWSIIDNMDKFYIHKLSFNWDVIASHRWC